jgi:3-hydroxyisobutyrate dehydrogenase
MARIGFFGLSDQGRAMARSLIAAGHQLSLFDPHPENVITLVLQGAINCSSFEDAIRDQDVIITVLKDTTAINDAYLTPDGIIANVSEGALIIDCSTIDIATSRDLSEQAASRGAFMIDAPCSGGVSAAEKRTLTFMVGGELEAFETALPILEAMGNSVVHAGGPCTGLAVKICNNMILGVTMVAVAEAFALAVQIGLDPQVLHDVASRSSGSCWSLIEHCPYPGMVGKAPSNRSYSGGFATASMLKDMRIAEAAAIEVGATIPLGAHAASLYHQACRVGKSDRDFSVIQKLFLPPEEV